MTLYLFEHGVGAVEAASGPLRRRGVRRPIDERREELGTAVMSDAVHHSLAFRDERRIQIGEDHSLSVRERRREQDALRRDNRGETPAAKGRLEPGAGRDLPALVRVEVSGSAAPEAPR